MMRLGVLGLGLLWASGCGSEDTKPGSETEGESSEPCPEVVWYRDLDLDGYGVAASEQLALLCEPPALHSRRKGDCDDADSAISPAAEEVCDGLDNNCDGLTDDADPDVRGLADYYVDTDDDSYGVGEAVGRACEPPAGHAARIGDCDDSSSAVHPEVPEQMGDELDNDCDGLVDKVGELSGVWVEIVGESSEREDWDCLHSWIIEGVVRPEICPTCDLSFWVEGRLDLEQSELVSSRCQEYDLDFGLAVLSAEDGGQYLGLIEFIPGGSYYDYYYVYYYVEDEYELTPWPSVPVSWDGTSLSLEKGWIDLPDERAAGTFYQTDWWEFAGVVE